MRYEDSMKGVADQIIKEQQRASKIKNNPVGRTIGKVLFYFKEVQNEKYSVRSRKHYFYQ